MVLEDCNFKYYVIDGLHNNAHIKRLYSNKKSTKDSVKVCILQ